jgi:hypothetical protein
VFLGSRVGGLRCESLFGGYLTCLAGVHRPSISPPGLGGITPPGRAVPTFDVGYCRYGLAQFMGRHLRAVALQRPGRM